MISTSRGGATPSYADFPSITTPPSADKTKDTAPPAIPDQHNGVYYLIANDADNGKSHRLVHESKMGTIRARDQRVVLKQPPLPPPTPALFGMNPSPGAAPLNLSRAGGVGNRKTIISALTGEAVEVSR